MQETQEQGVCSERSPEEGNGNILQSSCLGKPLSRRTWRATVNGVTKSQRILNDWTSSDHGISLSIPMHNIHLKKFSVCSSINNFWMNEWMTSLMCGLIALQVWTQWVSELVKVAQSYLTLCTPVDCSLPGSSVHGIL